MLATLTAWLDGVGSTAFTLSAAAFVLLNATGLAAVFLTRDRGLVNRWTSRFLAANLILLGTGLGIPLVSLAARSVIAAVVPAVQASLHHEVTPPGPGPEGGAEPRP
jgi:hypothetical protein